MTTIYDQHAPPVADRHDSLAAVVIECNCPDCAAIRHRPTPEIERQMTRTHSSHEFDACVAELHLRLNSRSL